jgi:hypothetical protein
MRRLSGSSGTYRLSASNHIEAFVLHTPPGSTTICDSRLVGGVYQDGLQDAVQQAIAAAASGDRRFSLDLEEAPTAALYVLRGGLNFATHRAMERITGRSCEVSFVTSERAVVDGASVVREDSYRKYSLAPKSVLVIGDIAASGRTICNTLAHLVRDQPEETLPRRIVLVVIGTESFLARLERFMLTAEGALLGRTGCRVTVLFLEGAFAVYSGSPELQGHLAHTDFFRAGGQLAPGAWVSAFESPPALLERCVIYDGGARGFEPRRHLESLVQYWRELISLFRGRPELPRLHLAVKAGLGTPWWDQVPSQWDVPETEIHAVYDALQAVRSIDPDAITAQCSIHLRRTEEELRLLIGEIR